MTGNLRWLANYGHDSLSNGVSFGMPWPKGLYQPGQVFVIEGNGQEYTLDSREIAYWADGSLKWTAHSVSGHVGYSEEYTVKGSSRSKDKDAGVVIEKGDASITVTTRLGLQVIFACSGSSSLFESVSLYGRAVCSGATLVASVDHKEYSTIVSKVEVENATSSRVVIKVSGTMASPGAEHLPFDVRVYIYSGALPIKILHSFVHDLDADEPLTSLGIRFSVPLEKTELYNRHVRFAGSDGGILKEEVQGLSGLRHGPTVTNRIDQTAGRAVILKQEEWIKTDLSQALSYIPSFDSYTLSQLSSDGFTIKKRTKKGCSWVKVTGGGRADGTVYLGSARHGGVAVGMSDFWERYPTQLDLAKLTQGESAITVWLYSPLAEPLDTSPYHDGLGLDSYEKQLHALDVTYEDYEPGFATANGIGRTNQFFLKPYTSTPSNQELSSFSALVRNPPRLVPTTEYMHSTGVFHGCWSPAHKQPPPAQEMAIEHNLDLLFSHYQRQIEQHRWYGFWDHGDVQHTYDPYRHAWRYDVGGFAWDNSELSTDLWLWLYFLHTGRGDVFRTAEAMTRHTSEVDVYHAGRFKGFGTRHGVQHFSDSSKQLRISNVLYRRIYFYLTGDERTGDLISELQDCQFALMTLDSHRKVQAHADVPEGFAMTNIGLDCGALAAAWLTAWERRTEDWEHPRALLIKLLDGIAGLKHGIGNNAILLNPTTGEIRECPPPTPEYAISHLSMLFGFPETFVELLDYARDMHPATVNNFMALWLSYCKAYNGGPEVQRREFGFEFPGHATWRQSHSTLTAFAAVQLKSEDLARAAWDQFFHTDGYTESHEWRVVETAPPEYFTQGEEAAWITTNEAARYGVSAIFNLANIREYLKP
ncbi:polysaccharide lyase family 26 protein [Aspergillus thermomutatus]|uniref:Tat pathway signal sequence domain protein n=1 Tax=Aspergillus thermomutatus TaxID=41047 RepID=A0A397HY20_ASPTH|nr:uncharacterized protein CDV56_109064 [Aspergillus thermomutatus]RHZ65983.1 hypothetical protein CDV56_109064 [Aspergillus thermomutatus]